MKILAASRAALIAIAIGAISCSAIAAQDEESPAGRGRGAMRADRSPAWFGVPLPPPLGEDPAVIVGTRAPMPVIVPPGEPAAPELTAQFSSTS